MNAKNIIQKLSTKIKNSKVAQKVTYMSALATCMYVNSVCRAEAKTPPVMLLDVTMEGLKNSINNLSLAVMGVMSGIILAIFAVNCQKEIIAIINGDEQEQAAAKKTIKKKAPWLIAGLLISDIIVLIAKYFLSTAVMPTTK